MATLQVRQGSYRIQVLFQGKLHSFTLGKVTPDEAEAKVRQADYWLMRLKQKLVTLPVGMSIVTFLEHDGHPPAGTSLRPTEPVQLGVLRDRYFETHGQGTLEANTIATCEMHFRHLVRELGARFPLAELTIATLQDYVNKRAKKVNPTTIRKELATFRAAWNWGALHGLTVGVFPNKGLRYAKTDEKPPFMTKEEIERQLAAGGSKTLWEALYLQLEEVTDLLATVQKRDLPPWVYPLFCFAAYTGARRSEIIRVKIADLDFVANSVTIREKKRKVGERTSRQIPIAPFLKSVLQEWLRRHPGGSYLFCHGSVVARSKKRSRTTGHQGKNRPTGHRERMATVRVREEVHPSALTKNEVHHYFKEALRGTPWEVVRGLHTLRHSFISICAVEKADQRMLESWSGHMSKDMSRRYTHLRSDRQHEELTKVFGAIAIPLSESVLTLRAQSPTTDANLDLTASSTPVTDPNGNVLGS